MFGIGDELVPLGAIDLDCEGVGIEAGAGNQGQNLAVARIHGDDSAFAIAECEFRGALQVVVDGEAQIRAGDGMLDVNSHNFVVRSRSLFAGHNLDTITLDAATDFYLLPEGLAGQEGSAAHVSDILEVISWARSEVPGLPVWIVGTSRGTGGAFVAGSYSPAQGGPDGLVFAASVNDSNDPDSLLMANLANITVPVLLINDAGSTCSIARIAGQPPVLKALKQSPRKGAERVPSGGLTALTGNCDALSDHGFFGIEDTAVRDIAVWMAK